MTEPIYLADIAWSWRLRLLRARLCELWENRIVIASMCLLIGLAAGMLSAARIAQRAEAEAKQKESAIHQSIGRACVEYVTSLNPGRGPGKGPDAVNIAENCGKIAAQAIYRLTWGPEGKAKGKSKKAKGAGYVKADTY